MTPEQSALQRRAKDSVEAARLLASQGYHGFAASRAYYAMFYVAQALLLIDGLAFSRHSGVIGAFGQHFVKTGRAPVEFHRYLVQAQNSRNTGDYDTLQDVAESEAAVHLGHAAEFLDLAARLLGPIDPVPSE